VIHRHGPAGVASSVYWNSVWLGLYLEDVWMGLIKPLFLAFAIVTIGCHVGLRTTGAPRRRKATTGGGGRSVAVLAVDFFVTKLLIVLMYP